MTTRNDIGDRLIYSCNCGWIDRGHAAIGQFRRPHRDPYVGAINLWRQINLELYPTKDVLYGKASFRVYAKQTMQRGGVKVGHIRAYLIKKGLSRQRKEEIALRIFLDVSYGFEKLQSGAPFSWFTDSGFSQEDLVSNVIGFYAAVRGFSDTQIEGQFCRVVSRQASLDVWDSNHPSGIGATKNYSYRQPVFYASAECPSNGRFPAVFESIKRANYGRDFIPYNQYPRSTVGPGRNYDMNGNQIRK